MCVQNWRFSAAFSTRTHSEQVWLVKADKENAGELKPHNGWSSSQKNSGGKTGNGTWFVLTRVRYHFAIGPLSVLALERVIRFSGWSSTFYLVTGFSRNLSTIKLYRVKSATELSFECYQNKCDELFGPSYPLECNSLISWRFIFRYWNPFSKPDWTSSTESKRDCDPVICDKVKYIRLALWCKLDLKIYTNRNTDVFRGIGP